MNQVLILTGPPGAGKSAVAEAICERFDRMLHVQVDDLRHWVKAGYRRPWDGDAQAAEQRWMAVANAAALARNAVAFRYAAVIDDVVHGEAVEAYREALSGGVTGAAEVHFVTLLPSVEAALARDARRGAASVPERVRAVHAEFVAAIEGGAHPGAVLDTSADADAAMTADRVQDALSRGLARFV
ncbi:MAG: AAA family ATPase [Dehalococcoidia bacterium]